MSLHPVFSSIKSGLIVSCQALEDEPLHGSEHMAVMACAARMGGAVGIRANTPQDISAIRHVVDLPIIGIYKQVFSGCEVYITPTVEAAVEVSRAGADIIALDATLRPHPGAKSAGDLIEEVIKITGKPVLADVDTFEAAIMAVKCGANAVSTTLSGYTKESPRFEGPDFGLLESLAKHLEVPVIAEGRFWTPHEVALALKLGAFAVVVGAAITRPQLITRRFVNEITKLRPGEAA